MSLPITDAFHVRVSRLQPAWGLGIIALLAVVVTASAIYARNGAVAGWEISVLKFFNGFPDWLEAPMWVVQQPGVLFFPFAAGAVIVAFSRRWHYAIPFLLLPVFKLSLEKQLIKTRVDRSRPFTSVGAEIQARGSSALDEPSFPSGHATTAVACGLLIAFFLPPKWRPVPIVWGVLVALGRLYYGEHNTLDVVCGAALGTAFAVAAWLLFINRWTGDGPPSADRPTDRHIVTVSDATS